MTTAPPPSPEDASAPARLLLVEDSEATAALMAAHLRAAGHRVAHAPTAAAAMRLLETQAPAAVILDLNLPDANGITLLRRLRAGPESPGAGARAVPAVIVVTGHGGVPEAVEAMRLGAFDFLLKPVDPPRLAYTVAAALDAARARARLRQRAASASEEAAVPGMLGEDAAMRAVFRRLRRAAQSAAPVLVTGETGTGKELAAHAVHALSPRGGRPFVALNCAAIPRELIESELFGHVRGAFTGAITDRPGAAGEAEGGTLFLDEIGELDQAVQAKLLRFLQSGSYRRLGAASENAADLRFVCATHRDLRAEVRAGRFREDLFYRLNVIPVALPPLRARGGDLPLLAAALLRAAAEAEGAAFRAIAPGALSLLGAHPWPGNVRELANVLRRVVVLEEGEVVTEAMLAPLLAETAPLPLALAPPQAPPLPLAPPAPPPAAAPRTPPEEAPAAELPGLAGSDIPPLEQIKRAAILRALRLTGGNVREAADRLGIAASTIYRMGLAGRPEDEAGP